MRFEVIGETHAVESIAVGSSVRRLRYLRKRYGPARWRKMKGIALVRLKSGRIWRAELHWYEAHGIGKRGMKIKRLLD
jgi:hypothetical protein